MALYPLYMPWGCIDLHPCLNPRDQSLEPRLDKILQLRLHKLKLGYELTDLPRP